MRAFLCIVANRQTKREVERLQKQLLTYGEGRLVPAENLHITLAFLGEISKADLPGIQQAMRIPFEPMDITFSKLGVFHRKKDVWWLGIEKNEKLEQTQKELIMRLKAEGFDVGDKAFLPHMTVVRNARFHRTDPQDIPLEPFSMKAERLVLMKSEQIDRKRVYTEIK